jgi:hypothetical protein
MAKRVTRTCKKGWVRQENAQHDIIQDIQQEFRHHMGGSRWFEWRAGHRRRIAIEIRGTESQFADSTSSWMQIMFPILQSRAQAASLLRHNAQRGFQENAVLCPKTAV